MPIAKVNDSNSCDSDTVKIATNDGNIDNNKPCMKITTSTEGGKKTDDEEEGEAVGRGAKAVFLRIDTIIIVFILLLPLYKSLYCILSIIICYPATW